MRFNQIWQAGRYDPAQKNQYPFFPAEVPGNIQYDYSRFIGIDDLQYGTNADRLIETEGWYWEYRTTLDFEEKDSVWFVSDGIDYTFDILLNDKKLHTQEGMYTRVELDLTGKAKPGDLLQIIIHPHPTRPLTEKEPYRSAADRSSKPPVTYGWDWNPRLLISGLWQPAYIETRATDFIKACEPFYSLNEDRTEADLRFETDCNGNVIYSVWDPRGNLIYQGNEPNLHISDVQLWWCNGQGEPNLYRWSATSSSDHKEGTIGFRTFRLIQNPGTQKEPFGFPKSRYAARITPELNGRVVFAKGSNWVNPELFFGRVTRERLEELILLGRDANMNMFRIWGGSGICKKDFYELCDQYGIMVWQEFMLACNEYEGRGSYLKILEQEARSIITTLRRHPSIILWCGGNELFNGWSQMDEQSHSLRLLNALCYELDRDRPFLFTSPMAGMAHGGYCFIDPDTKKDPLALFQGAHYTGYTEFGISSLAAPNLLKKIIPEEELFPIEPTDAWVIHHAFNELRQNQWYQKATIETYFGEQKTLADTVEKSNLLQCVGYQGIFEEARKQAPYCSMAINWCYCEPWICGGNNSIISYPAIPKPAYYAVKNALRPIMASARIPKYDWKPEEVFSAQIWLLNDTTQITSATITATLWLEGERLATVTWRTGETTQNLIGPSINAVLPKATDLSEMKLILTADNAAFNSEYTLCFKNKYKKQLAREMNA